MTKTRLEAFSDGVIAIIITIMVLDLKTPHHTDWVSIKPLVPVFISYIISYIFVGIYWGNHHHLLHTVSHVNSKIIWANLHLLFWLSLIPFTTAWIGETNFDKLAVAVYAGVQFFCGLAYFILLKNIEESHPNHPGLKVPLQKQSKKGLISLITDLLAIAAAFINPLISAALFVFIAVIWFVPDRNIEKSIDEKG